MKYFVYSLFLLSLFLFACAPQLNQDVVACPAIAMKCSDGSFVGPQGPKCEFAPCPESNTNGTLPNISFCTADSDCICGGIDKATNDCFVGNKEYYETNVDKSKGCPDFCIGIAANLETKCVENECKVVHKERLQIEAKDNVSQATANNEPNAAHWLCEDSSWKVTPEDCFANTCLDNSDCQIVGVKGLCPYKIAAPKTMHKPPVFYEDRCGGNVCTIVPAMCAEMHNIRNVVCEEGKCLLVFAE